jgi:fatty acid desaturase
MQKVEILDYLSTNERRALLKKNNWLAIKGVAEHWLWIIFALLLPYFFTNAITIVISLFILGGKQLACAILMHDASHFSVFENRKANDFVGHWFGGAPIFQDVIKYRPYHISHHINTGLEEDPDILLTRAYPTTKSSMARKFLRDLFGLTGLKAFIGLLLMNLGLLEYNLGNKVVKISQKGRTVKSFFASSFNNLWRPILANVIMFILLYTFASGWLYLLWIGAYITTFQICIRIRSIAEHSVVEDPTNPYLNTRTTYANFIEKMLFAPYNVNFHAEHHMLMSVPPYNLPKMHEFIKAKGFYEKGVLEKNYWNIIKMTIKDLTVS